MLAVAAILKRLTAAIAAVALDPYFNNVSLLLTANGTDGTGNKTFVDSASGLTVSVGAGQPTQGSFNPFNPNYAGYFNGSSYLTSPNNAGFDFGSSNFTIEAWVRFNSFTAGNGNVIVSKGPSGSVGTNFYSLQANTAGALLFVWASGTAMITGSTTLVANRWYHVAVTRSSNTFTMYIDGVSSGTTTNSTSLVAGGPCIIGSQSYAPGATDRSMTGNISNLRIVKGYALYTSNFTPQAQLSDSILGIPRSAVSLLTLQTGAFVDLSTNSIVLSAAGSPTLVTLDTSLSSSSLSSVTLRPAYDATLHNSVYFDGTNDLLSATNSGQFDIDSGTAFTAEAWIYQLNNSGENILMGVGGGGANWNTTNGHEWLIFPNYSGTFYFQYNNGGGDSGVTSITTTTVPTLSAWNHIAVTYNGSTIYMWLNGQQVQSAAATITKPTTRNRLRIGSNPSNTAKFNGYVSNLRIVKGSALYTSNFTPSVSGLTSLAGTGYSTSLLTCQGNVVVDNGSSNLALSSTGNPTVTSFNPFGLVYSDYKQGFYGGSAYFDGSSWLTSASNSTFAVGTNNFTIEFWIYFNSITTGNGIGPGIFSTGSPTSQQNGNIYLYYGGTTTAIRLGVVGGAETNFPFTALTNTWYHVAVVRTSTGVGGSTCYVNGVSIGTGQIATNFTTQNGAFIGGVYNANYLNGYLTNFRFVNGTAVYTAAFTPPKAPVANIPNTSLLLNFSNAGIYDITRKNNLIQYGTATVSQSAKFGTGSMYFNGTDGYLNIPSTSQFNFGTSDWTVEFWVYPLAYGGTIVGGQLFGTVNGSQAGYSINLGQDINSFRVISNASGSWTDDLSVGTGPSLNTWTHFAIVRNGSVLTIYKNGTSVATKTGISAYNYSGTTAIIGKFSESINTRYLNGYIDDLRITKGIARYTSNFSVPSRELPSSNVTQPDSDPYFSNVSLLLRGDGLSGAQNNTFRDSSTNNSTVTKNINATQGSFSPFSPNGNVYNVGEDIGSAYFDGSSYLTVPYSTTLFDWWTTGVDYTIEYWFYATALSNESTASRYIGNSDLNTVTYWSFGPISDRTVKFYYWTGSIQSVASTETIKLSAWNHIAMVKNSSGIRIFVNGVPNNATAIAGSPVSTGGSGYIMIGANPSGNLIAAGTYISNIRIVKGTAVYTSAFTPPTAPVGNITNTSLLLNFTNAGIYDLVAKNDILTVGNARIDTGVKKFGTGSLYFDGSSYLSIPSNAALALSNSNWTIECWIYDTSAQTGVRAFGAIGSTATGDIRFGLNDNKIYCDAYGAGGISTGTINIPTNTWTHIAFVRSSNTIYAYVNGVLDSSAATTANTTTTTATIGSIGTANYWTGYIDDLRITKGIARYTSNFTVPTAPLPIQAV